MQHRIMTHQHLVASPAELEALPLPLALSRTQFSTLYDLLRFETLRGHSQRIVHPTDLPTLLQRVDWLLSSSTVLKDSLRKHGTEAAYSSPALKDWTTLLKTLRELADYARVAGHSLCW